MKGVLLLLADGFALDLSDCLLLLDWHRVIHEYVRRATEQIISCGKSERIICGSEWVISEEWGWLEDVEGLDLRGR